MIKLIYSDIAVGSREAFEPTADGAHEISHINEIMPAGITFPNFSTICELNQTLLDGSMRIMPDDTSSEYIGLWSNAFADENGMFTDPPSVTMTASGLYSSQGMTITTADAYPTAVNIKWYRDDALLSDMDFTPDASVYYCENRVDSYNKVTITFNALVLPYRRLKLYGVAHGRIREFDGRQLADASIIQECSPISAEVAINTFDFTLIGDSNIDYVFQSKQSLEIYSGGNLLGVFFVSTYNRTAQRFYNVSSEDYMGILDAVRFAGGIYEKKNASELLTAIFDGASVPFEIDESLKGETVTGWIPICTCREAVRQICFAIGAAVDTTLSAKVRVFAPPDEIAHEFTLGEIMQGQTLTDRDRKLTEVRMTVHGFAKGDKTQIAYDSDKSGTGSDIFVEFNDPLHDLAITNGTIVESGANYAIITAGTGCVLTGTAYNHTRAIRSMHNPLVNANDPANVVSVEDMTLISADNAATRLQSVYDYYVVQGSINSEMVMAKLGGTVAARPADKIKIATAYAGTITARLESMRYKLYGGAIVAETDAH